MFTPWIHAFRIASFFILASALLSACQSGKQASEPADLRAETEWCQMYWYHTNAANLKRVCLIGDSIAAGHSWQIQTLLEGRASVSYFASSKAACDPALLQETAFFLREYTPDVILLNNGLHGSALPDESYRCGLLSLVRTIRAAAPHAVLLWRSSTPVVVMKPDGKTAPSSKDRIVIRRNAIAADLMRELNIPVIDLYSFLAGKPELHANGSHFTAAGNQAQAEFLLPHLEAALESAGSPPEKK